MSRQQISPEPPDLFGLIQQPVAPRSDPIRTSTRRASAVPQLARLSDAELSQMLGNVVQEVQRRERMAGLRQGRPELVRAVEDAASSLARLTSEPSDAARPQRRQTPEILETKRNAIRAALSAGVKATQVAKHFGVPLGVVRQIGTDRQ